jgi:HTH-type transcriptional regulator/antitoxin HipB
MYAPNTESLGNILRTARKAKGLTQAELAARIGVTRHWVVQAEKGEPNTRAELFIKALASAGMAIDVIPTPHDPAMEAMLAEMGYADDLL